MISLLKTFGKGLLYVIGAPFFVVALALFGVVGLFQFLFQIIKSVIFFFTGQKFFPELPEDKELRLMKEKAYRDAHPEEQVNETTQNIITPIKEEPIITPTPIVVERPAPTTTIEETCFNEPQQEEITEEEKEDINVLDNLLSDNVGSNDEHFEEETILETENKKIEEPEEEEELETYVPRSSNFTDNYEDEDDTEIGVDIDYDL